MLYFILVDEKITFRWNILKTTFCSLEKKCSEESCNKTRNIYLESQCQFVFLLSWKAFFFLCFCSKAWLGLALSYSWFLLITCSSYAPNCKAVINWKAFRRAAVCGLWCGLGTEHDSRDSGLTNHCVMICCWTLW